MRHANPLAGLRRIVRPGREPGRAERLERTALALLAGDGCAACRLAEESAARWVGYFVSEGNAEPEVLAEVRASLGPCGRHARRLVAARGGPEVLAAVSAGLAREARRRLDAPAPWSPCPACGREAWAEGHVADTLLRAQALPSVAGELERRQGLCLPHTLAALPLAEARGAVSPPGLRLAALAEAALRGAEGEAAVERVGGLDPDARARADGLRGAALPDRGRPVRAWLLAVLEQDGCPSCAAEREAERHVLEWTATATGLEAWELRFCASHLATLHALDAITGRRVAQAAAGEWSSALGRFVEAASQAPRRGALARLLRRGEPDEALPNLLGNRACRACDVARVAGGRMNALVGAAAGERGVGDVYARSHGLCLRHAEALPPAVRAGVVVETLRARLATVGWELDEAVRKRSWFSRWEPAGQEPSAWRRLPGFVDGCGRGI
jgi:hypothetical protein